MQKVAAALGMGVQVNATEIHTALFVTMAHIPNHAFANHFQKIKNSDIDWYIMMKVTQIYFPHFVYSISIVFSTILVITYLVWQKHYSEEQLIKKEIIQTEESEKRRLNIHQCLDNAQKNYDNQLQQSCTNFRTVSQCMDIIGVIAPIRLKLLYEKLSEGRELCVKTN